MFLPKLKRRHRKGRRAFHHTRTEIPRTRRRRSLEPGSAIGRLRAGLGKSPERKEIDRVSCSTGKHQVSRNFANDRGELEPVTGETSAEKEMLVFGMAIDDEIPIRREGVETSFGGQ